MVVEFPVSRGTVARWLQTLQEYDFEVQHRPGKSHGNANALSRRSCGETGCTYCIQVEEKNQNMQIQHVGRVMASKGRCSEKTPCVVQCELIFQMWSMRDLEKKQADDPDISPLIRWKKQSEERPSWGDIFSNSALTRLYWTQ
jgi:hypothetical protein